MKGFLCGLVVLVAGFFGGLYASRFEGVRNAPVLKNVVGCPCVKQCPCADKGVPCPCCDACPGKACAPGCCAPK